MSVRFDPRVISAEEAARLNAPPAAGLNVPHNPQPSRDSQGNFPSASNAPPRPTEAYPKPPSSVPPMRKKRDVCLPFRPSVWDVAHELFYWADPAQNIAASFPNFPQDWKLEHANANSSNQNRLQVSTTKWP